MYFELLPQFVSRLKSNKNPNLEAGEVTNAHLHGDTNSVCNISPDVTGCFG